MIKENHRLLAEKLKLLCNEFDYLAFACKSEPVKTKKIIPSDNAENLIIDFLVMVVEEYKHDYYGLSQKYHSSLLWKKAISKAVLMDNDNDCGYYLLLKHDPNILLDIYMSDYSSLGLQRIFEMFLLGYSQNFTDWNISMKKMLDNQKLNNASEEVLLVVHEYIFDHGQTDKLPIAQFLAWLYPLSVKKIEQALCSYGEEADEIYNSIAELCRDIMQRESKDQLALNF